MNGPYSDIVRAIAGVYKPAAQGERNCAPKNKKQGVRWNAGQNQELSANRQGAVHERAPARIFSREAARVARRYSQGSQGNAAAPSGRKSESSRSCRPRFLGDRSR